MNIKFGNTTLTDWTDQPQPDIKGYPVSGDRHRLFNTPDNEWKIGVSLRPHPHADKMWYVLFYHQFRDLHEVFPLLSCFEATDIDNAKQHVDRFLLRMSKLTPFL